MPDEGGTTVVMPPVEEGKEVSVIAPIDPGQMEGLSPQEKEIRTEGNNRVDEDGKPGPDHPRWNEIYKKAEDRGRELGELNTKYDQTTSTLTEMRTLNSAMYDELQILKANSQAQPNQPDEFDVKMLSLTEEKKVALADENYTKAMEISDDINDLNLNKVRLELSAANNKDTFTQDEIDKRVNDIIASKSQTSDRDTFQKMAPWFNESDEKYDVKMASLAVGIDAAIQTDQKYSHMDGHEKLKEVKRQVEELFNYNQPPATPPSVSGISLGGGAPASNTVKLSPEEVRVAKNLFPDNPNALIMYAEQKKLTQGGN